MLSEAQQLVRDLLPLSLVETAAYMGLSRARTWQLEKRAMNRMRKRLMDDSDIRELLGLESEEANA